MVAMVAILPSDKATASRVLLVIISESNGRECGLMVGYADGQEIWFATLLKTMSADN